MKGMYVSNAVGKSIDGVNPEDDGIEGWMDGRLFKRMWNGKEWLCERR